MPQAQRQSWIAVAVACVVFGMVGMSYAAVPLYKMFCAATGYNGTTQVAIAAPAAPGTRSLNVRFDTNVGAGLAWTFEPEVSSMEVPTGKTVTAFYKVTNKSRAQVTGIARYNVSPDASGAYFDKISCFCFSELTLDAGQTMDLPVVFFLDPALEKDDLMKNVAGITLSYTFYPVEPPPVAAAKTNARKL